MRSIPRAGTILTLLAGALALSACASTSGPAPAGPAPAEAAPVVPPPAERPSPGPAAGPTELQPSPEALRAAERAELTGVEMGTMWTFENPPYEHWASTYDFTASEDWLEHVRLSSVRYGQICSASFVSPDGLVMTNHHCARDCAEAVSSAENDRVETGFYAATRSEELVCPGLYLDQLIDITDVTARVRGAVAANATDTEIADAQDAERETIQAECEAETGLTCQVVSLYQGGQYQLYKYQRYEPVKLVFIPELQAGFYGGDPDNFTYPRYALDVAFVRAYEPDSTTAVRTPHHFEWDADGAEEGELVFVTGNPGSTSRLATVSQVLYEQRFRHPFVVQIYEAQREILRTIASYGPEAERVVRDNLFSVENSLKAYTGQLGGLRDTLLLGSKILWERQFRAQVDADPTLRSQYGDVWAKLADLQVQKLETSPRLNAYDSEFIGAPHLQMAGELVRFLTELEKPESDRDPDFESGRAAAEASLRTAQPVNPQVARMLLAAHLQVADRWLTADDPFRQAAFRPGESAEETAGRLARESRIMDAGYRGEILNTGLAAALRSSDPLLRLALLMERDHPGLETRWEALSAAEGVQEERLAEALFAVFGTDLPPDATFTLRISDGVVQRYPYNGTYAPPSTSLYGLYERAANFDGEMPWTLPAAFAARRDAVDLSTPLNFVTTNDITGGNSGSPMINRSARIVGIAFDGNIEQLPNEFLFRLGAGRTVGVHSAGITEALRSVYQAEALLDELLGEAP